MKSASGGGTIFDLDIEGTSNKAIVRDIQRDPVTSNIIHIDLFAISMSKPISISVPVTYVGDPIGVKTDGGIMQVTLRELDISCLPANIPDTVDIDVSELGIGEALHVSDLSIPDVKVLTEERRTMVVISAPTVIKAEVTAEDEEGLEGEEGEEGAEATEGEAAAAALEAEQPDKKPKKEKSEKTDRR